MKRRGNPAACWGVGACLFVLLACSQMLRSQGTAPKQPTNTAGKRSSSAQGTAAKEAASNEAEDTADSAFYSPNAVAVDSSGNVYIVDTYNNRVLKETPKGDSYTQSVVLDHGLFFCSGVAVDGGGNVYIVDSGDNRVLKETPSGSSYLESTVGSDLRYPFSVAVDGGGNVYVTDTGNNRVVKETLAGAATRRASLWTAACSFLRGLQWTATAMCMSSTAITSAS